MNKSRCFSFPLSACNLIAAIRHRTGLGISETGAGPQAPINETTLQLFTAGDEGLRNEILGQFLDATRADLAQLDSVLGGDDFQRIRQAAHRAKGASRMVGAEPFAAELERIEKAAAGADRAGIDQAAGAMRAEAQRLTEYIQHSLRDRQGGP